MSALTAFISVWPLWLLFPPGSHHWAITAFFISVGSLCNYTRQGGVKLLFWMCSLVLSWWCCLRPGHLIVSWFLIAQSYMLGDVTSIVSSCQLSGGCVTRQISYVHNLHSFCRLITHTLVWNYHVWLICCPGCILSLFCVQILPPWNQYTSSI